MKPDHEIQAQIRDLFTPYAQPDSPGAAVGIVFHGMDIFFQGFGQATLEHYSPITPDTVFDVGSMAKQFVGMAIALLEEDGQLSLGDKIHHYLPELPSYYRDITLADLLYHTSGIRNYTVLAYYMMGYHESDAITRDEVFDLLLRLRSLHFPPGTRWEYSDTNYFLLGIIIERITGISIQQYAQEAIFHPLAMHDTLFRQCHSQVISHRALSYVSHPVAFRSPYAYRGQQAAPGSFYTLTSNYEHVGAEGLFTSLADLQKWERNLRANRLGKDKLGLIKRVLSPGARINADIGYGYGINIGNYKGKNFYGHDGAIHGYTSSMMHFPEEDVSIICLTNHNRVGAWEYRDRIMDILFANPDRTAEDRAERVNAANSSRPEPPPAVTPNPLPGANLSQYVGEYYSAELGTTFRVAEDNRKLILRNKNQHFCSMDLLYTPTGEDNFVANDPHPITSQITFLRAGNRIEAFVYRDEDGDGREALRFVKQDDGCTPGRTR